MFRLGPLEHQGEFQGFPNKRIIPDSEKQNSSLFFLNPQKYYGDILESSKKIKFTALIHTQDGNLSQFELKIQLSDSLLKELVFPALLPYYL